MESYNLKKKNNSKSKWKWKLKSKIELQHINSEDEDETFKSIVRINDWKSNYQRELKIWLEQTTS